MSATLDGRVVFGKIEVMQKGRRAELLRQNGSRTSGAESTLIASIENHPPSE